HGLIVVLGRGPWCRWSLVRRGSVRVKGGALCPGPWRSLLRWNRAWLQYRAGRRLALGRD
ncbi:MAG: hypothetical protein WBB88_11075, partial [Methyloceanibacter sp.]